MSKALLDVVPRIQIQIRTEKQGQKAPVAFVVSRSKGNKNGNPNPSKNFPEQDRSVRCTQTRTHTKEHAKMQRIRMHPATGQKDEKRSSFGGGPSPVTEANNPA